MPTTTFLLKHRATKDEDSYVFFNRNPNGDKIEDCVCRAISTATGLNYYQVGKLLDHSARVNKCEKLCVCCYHNLLEKVLRFKVHFCNGETVEDVARQYPNDTVIIRIANHLTTAVNGSVLDIWDCTGLPVDCYWIVK